jgi:hypothetical protein
MNQRRQKDISRLLPLLLRLVHCCGGILSNFKMKLAQTSPCSAPSPNQELQHSNQHRPALFPHERSLPQVCNLSNDGFAVLRVTQRPFAAVEANLKCAERVELPVRAEWRLCRANERPACGFRHKSIWYPSLRSRPLISARAGPTRTLTIHKFQEPPPGGVMALEASEPSVEGATKRSRRLVAESAPPFALSTPPSLRKRPNPVHNPKRQRLSAVDFRWAAQRGFYNPSKSAWVRGRGGVRAYLDQRKTCRSGGGGVTKAPLVAAVPASPPPPSLADVPFGKLWFWKEGGEIVGYRFYIPPELSFETNLFRKVSNA